MTDPDGAYLWCGNCGKNSATFAILGSQAVVYLCDECAAKHIVDAIVKADHA